MKKLLLILPLFFLLSGCDTKKVTDKDRLSGELAAIEGLVTIQEIFLNTLIKEKVISQDKINLMIQENEKAREHINEGKRLLGINDIKGAESEIDKSDEESEKMVSTYKEELKQR